MSIKRGEIYYIQGLPVTRGSEQWGDRPAIVVSNDTGNRFSSVIEVVYVTTAQKSPMPTHFDVNSTPKPSVALCEQIHSISKSRILSCCGKLTPDEMNALDNALKISLALHERQSGEAEKGVLCCG